MDSASEAKLAKVHPLLAERVRKVIADLSPVEYRVVQGLRTYAEQDALFKKRPRVTHARGGFSSHNFGLAVDLCPFVDGEFAWNADKLFNNIGVSADKFGLEWGGDWKFVDKPHVQLPGLAVSLCRQLYSKGGLPAVWAKISDILDFAANTSSPQANVSDTDALTHKVVSGDSLWKLASQYQISVSELKHKNGLTSDKIMVGQVLKIK